MALYTESQAKKIAAEIFSTLREEVNAACQSSSVPPAFLASLISVENPRLSATAKRFEPHVYEKLIEVRDGARASYNNVKQSQLSDAGDMAVKALAHSYGYTQIMAYWCFRLNCTVKELRDPAKHLAFAVELLKIVAGKHLRGGDYSAALRIWNTGSPTGKTHDPAYVSNALAVKEKYEALERASEPIAEEVTRAEFDALLARVAVLEEK